MIENNKNKNTDMFDAIATNYDRLNHLLSFGMDFVWRKKAAKMMKLPPQSFVIDLACGTGDLSVAIAKKQLPKTIIGLDLSLEMLKIGQKKIRNKGLEQTITLRQGDGERTQLPNNCCQGVSIGFGIRNFDNPQRGLQECFRILDNLGKLMILEFSMPQNPFLRGLYNLYFKQLLPLIGEKVSKHPSAYRYLPESVERFSQNINIQKLIEDAGFHCFEEKKLFFGIAHIYLAQKPLLS